MHRSFILVAVLLAAAPAAARVPQGAEVPAGNDELSVHMGYQQGFGGDIGTPSGFKLFGEYAHRLGRLVWLDLQLNQVFGFGVGADTCFDVNGNPYPCTANFYYGGWATEIGVGVKLKIPTPIPLVVEVPIVGAVEVIYDRACGDDGAAVPVVRFGAGVKYFVTPRIGVGGGIDFALGPAFHKGSPCSGSYVDFFGTFDFQVGAEFIL